MKITTDFPPNYANIVIAIPEVQNGKPIFCYGDTIYNPHKIEITKDLEAHEEVHRRQQGNNPDLWWEKYLQDPEFRLRQELEAYGIQYASVREFVHGRLREWVLDNIATALSGALYGNLLTFAEARSKVRNYAKN